MNMHASFLLRNESAQNKIKTRIVVPCYNEANRLNQDAFLNFAAENKDIGFLFVDDGSRDATHTLLLNLAAQCPAQFQVMQLAQNSGKAEAVRSGLARAAMSDVKYIGYWDADLATPLAAINDFLRVMEYLSEVDVIFGARAQLLGHRINRTFGRLVVSRICASLARLAIALPVNDTQCGAKIFRNTKLLKSVLQTRFSTGWLFDVELFARVSHKTVDARKSFFEYPLVEWKEIAGSKVNAKAIVKAGFSMLGLIARTRLKQVKSSRRVSKPAPVEIAHQAQILAFKKAA